MASTAVVLLFTGTSAFAADAVMASPIEPSPTVTAPQSFGWSGLYLGAFGGGGFGGNAEVNQTFVAAPNPITNSSYRLNDEETASGFLGGVRGGYDLQFGSFVLGASASIAASNIKAESNISSFQFGAGNTTHTEQKLDYLGTVDGRLGYAFDRTLIYAHGGFAYGSVSLEGYGATDDVTQTGYDVGGGVEFAVTQHLSLQAEYSYVDLGKSDFSVPAAYATGATNGFGATSTSSSEELDFHTVTVGLNYRF